MLFTDTLIGKLKVTEIFFEVPIDYSSPESGRLQLFARTVVKNEKAAAHECQPLVPLPQGVAAEPNSINWHHGGLDFDNHEFQQLPWFLYLQGGPGFGCPSPQHAPLTNFVLDRGYQLVYLDQRGTGHSCAITAETLALQGSPEQQADYLKLFRADSIVKDCEAVRKALTTGFPDHLQKWYVSVLAFDPIPYLEIRSVLGQSFGGFCVLTYLSMCPQGLRETFTTGGLAPIGKAPDIVYEATYQRVIARNKMYYERYPEDVEAIQEIAVHIESNAGIRLPSGATLTVQLFLTLGRNFGSHGGLEFVHDLVLRLKTDLIQFNFITRPALSDLDAALTLENSVIYAVLHESIYCQKIASNWSADRVGKSIVNFSWLHESPNKPVILRQHPLYFAGEMIYRFMFEVFPELKPLVSAAEILAKFSDWPELYNEVQLARNEVPLYALTYVDDMYVDFQLALGTAKLIKNCKHAITNQLQHNAIRSRAVEAFRLLFVLRDDELD